MRITKWRPANAKSKYSARYYLNGFRSMPIGMTAWIAPDYNGEFFLDCSSEPTEWLHVILDVILVELLDAGLITDNEYWYLYIHVFDWLARLSSFLTGNFPGRGLTHSSWKR